MSFVGTKSCTVGLLFRGSASVDQTMATWGGSTVDNLESIEEDEGNSGDGQEADDDGELWHPMSLGCLYLINGFNNIYFYIIVFVYNLSTILCNLSSRLDSGSNLFSHGPHKSTSFALKGMLLLDTTQLALLIHCLVLWLNAHFRIGYQNRKYTEKPGVFGLVNATTKVFKFIHEL